MIHEQNAVLGRANRLLAPRVRRIATGFPATAGLRPADRGRTVHTGNPVRPAVLAVAQTKYKAPQRGGPIELLVLGGSQGARIMSEAVPPALAALPTRLREMLRVSHQARPEDLPAAEAIYREKSHPSGAAELFRRRPGDGWRERIWRFAAPALRPSPNSPRSAGPPS